MNTTERTSSAAELDEGSRAALRLSLIPNVGPVVTRSLLNHFQSPSAVLGAAASELRRVPGVGSTLAHAIACATQTIDIDAELKRCQENQIQVIPRSAEEYPQSLSNICDPPSILYCVGSLEPRDMLAIAIVGTRHATSYGKRMARRLASGLARAGLTIVSGLARGIDIEAHLGALEVGGRTIAVLPAGLTHIYPLEHKEIAFDISHQGALVSESPSLVPVSRGAFPRRNRIITGLSLGTVVIEAADRSGALVSARHAMEQGREVFALPGPADSRVSRGCHQLIRDGAKLVENVDHVLEELGPLVQATTDADGESVRHPAELSLNEQEQHILRLIESQATSIDAVVVQSGLPVSRVLATINALELRRLIRRVSGHNVVRL